MAPNKNRNLNLVLYGGRRDRRPRSETFSDNGVTQDDEGRQMFKTKGSRSCASDAHPDNANTQPDTETE